MGMENFLPYIWMGVILAALVVEANTAALVSIWFIPGAIISMILAYFGVPVYVQVIVFLVLSAIFLLFSWKIFKKTKFVKPVATNVDSLIGENAIVIEPIDNLAFKGQVKVRGQVWTARSYQEEEKYDKGEILEVVAIEGVKLIVKKEKI